MAGDPESVYKQIKALDVSIRARHRWRAIHSMEPLPPSSMSFQSAPAIDGGRSRVIQFIQPADKRFQSAPAIDGGRSASRAIHC